MSEPKWTPAQRAAIEDRGGALLVSAAAGSGKTAVLTERAVRLITHPEHPVDADRLPIVPFPNAAAAALRARLRHALLKPRQPEPRPRCPPITGCQHDRLPAVKFPWGGAPLLRLKLGEQAMFPELAVQLAPGNPQSPGGQHLVVAGIDQRLPQYLAFGPGAGF